MIRNVLLTIRSIHTNTTNDANDASFTGWLVNVCSVLNSMRTRHARPVRIGNVFVRSVQHSLLKRWKKHLPIQMYANICAVQTIACANVVFVQTVCLTLSSSTRCIGTRKPVPSASVPSVNCMITMCRLLTCNLCLFFVY